MMLFILAAIRLLSPVDGGEVALLPECQRTDLVKGSILLFEMDDCKYEGGAR